jgi:hypothetical protein
VSGLPSSFARRSFSAGRRSGSRHPVQVPAVGDALERVLTPVLEGQARSRGEVLHRRADPDLAGPGLGANPCPQVDGDAGDPVLGALDLAGVETGPDLDAEGPRRLACNVYPDGS